MVRAGSLSGSNNSSTTLTYTWTVSDFSTYKSGKISSPEFPINDSSVRMQMEVIPDGVRDMYGEYVSCFLTFSPTDFKKNMITSLQLLLQFCNLEHIHLRPPHSFRYDLSDPDGNSHRLGNSRFIERNDLLESLVDDTLLVSMEIMFSTRAIVEVENPTVDDYPELDQSNLLLRVWDRLLKDSKFKDFVISVRGTDLPVHRAVLAANSPVFEAMLDPDTVEKGTSRLQMDDVDQETAKLFLQFMYSGSTDLINMSIALQLLDLSDEYDMQHLKTYSVNFIITHLDNGNVAQVLVSSDKFNAPMLRNSAIEYFCKNKSAFDFNGELRSVLEERPSILTDIIMKLPPLA